jgi:hypothetical protein
MKQNPCLLINLCQTDTLLHSKHKAKSDTKKESLARMSEDALLNSFQVRRLYHKSPVTVSEPWTKVSEIPSARSAPSVCLCVSCDSYNNSVNWLVDVVETLCIATGTSGHCMGTSRVVNFAFSFPVINVLCLMADTIHSFSLILLYLDCRGLKNYSIF